jgi:large subunit ribosomal protein LP2
MRYVAAYLLAVLGGNKNPSAEIITGILQAGGIEVDQAKVTFLLKELEGKDLNEGIV